MREATFPPTSEYVTSETVLAEMPLVRWCPAVFLLAVFLVIALVSCVPKEESKTADEEAIDKYMANGGTTRDSYDLRPRVKYQEDADGNVEYCWTRIDGEIYSVHRLDTPEIVRRNGDQYYYLVPVTDKQVVECKTGEIVEIRPMPNVFEDRWGRLFYAEAYRPGD